MREIKFRGKDKKNGKWLYGNVQIPKPPFDKYFMWDENGIQCQVDEDTIGQFTGLKDKDGHDIYEGDILKASWKVELCVVWYSETTASFMVDYIPNDNWTDTLGEYTTSELKIIGNVHDNPELIEGE